MLFRCIFQCLLCVLRILLTLQLDRFGEHVVVEVLVEDLLCHLKASLFLLGVVGRLLTVLQGSRFNALALADSIGVDLREFFVLATLEVDSLSAEGVLGEDLGGRSESDQCSVEVQSHFDVVKDCQNNL